MLTVDSIFTKSIFTSVDSVELTVFLKYPQTYFFKKLRVLTVDSFLQEYPNTFFSKSWQCWQLTVFFNTFITTTTRALLCLNPLKTRRYKSHRNHKHLRFVFRGKLSKNFQKTFRKLSNNFRKTFKKRDQSFSREFLKSL